MKEGGTDHLKRKTKFRIRRDRMYESTFYIDFQEYLTAKIIG